MEGGFPSVAPSCKMSNDPPPDSAAAPTEPTASQAEARLIYRSGDLLKDRREIFIEHGRDLYRLRITSQGRLILTK
jgi:hemin uptake protein HemP